MSLQEKESLYLQAKEEYYAGTPIMSDEEFDNLEQNLKSLSSDVIYVIGTVKAPGVKGEHLTRMCSLNKLQVNVDINEWDSNPFFKWLNDKQYSSHLEYTPKFDGNAINLIYEKGKLKLALTRYNGVEGQIVTEKLKKIVPTTIPVKEKCEIRGELLIPIKIFNDLYSLNYMNPRNFIGGILNRDDNYEDVLPHLHFCPFEIRLIESNKFMENSFKRLKEWGFEETFNIISDPNDIKNIYTIFKNYRENESIFQLDGFVAKFVENSRTFEKSNPSWGMAIKFPAKIAITKIVDINWTISKTGEMIPVGMLEPVLLDGSMIRNVLLYNAGSVLENGWIPGTEISLVKSGDIIPKVVSVITKSNSTYELPTEYKGLKTIFDGIHLMIENSDVLEEIVLRKFTIGANILGIAHMGPATIKKLYTAGVLNISQVFTMTKENLIASKEFKKGKALDNIFSAIDDIKTLKMSQLVHSLQFVGVGHRTAEEIANMMEEKSYNFSGLEKLVIEPFLQNESKEIKLIMEFKEILEKRNIFLKENVLNTEKEIIGSIEMTGSPKTHGFSTKEEFIKLALDNGYIHGNLNKDSKYLITDSLDSSSSKMAKARKLGVKILTYSDFVEIVKN